MQAVDVTRDMYPTIVSDLLQEWSLTPSTKATVVALQGDLGAGKTTLTQAIARTLGVTEVVTSPTFVVQKIYPISHERWVQLVHIDAYRIEDLSELGPLRISELWLQPNLLVIIEWPERIFEALPTETYALRLTTIDTETRRLEPVQLTSLQI